MSVKINRSLVNSATRLVAILLIFFAVSARAAEEQPTAGEIPVPNTVTLVELGADNCIPCRLLGPIIKELKEEYQGRAAVVSINVYSQHERPWKFHALVTPTIIFFDRRGHETGRHSGFMDKDAIVRELDGLLAK